MKKIPLRPRHFKALGKSWEQDVLFGGEAVLYGRSRLVRIIRWEDGDWTMGNFLAGFRIFPSFKALLRAVRSVR